MQIINVLEILNGLPSQIKSFPIIEDGQKISVVSKAEEFFIRLCQEHSFDLTPDDIDFILSEGSYDDKCGYEVYIIWSN